MVQMLIHVEMRLELTLTVIFSKESTEIHVLLDQVEKGNYQTLFNLHDQRTIFNVGQTAKPATLSFLAPSYNVEEDVNEVREKRWELFRQ